MLNDKELDNWDNFISGNFLKAVNVNSENDAFVCINVDLVKEKDDERLRVTLEKNEQSFEFDINKTNAVKLKELGIESPKRLIGKKLYFKKALVRNPNTNKEVEGLRIWKVD